jgi:methionine-S-sulfoxide reductase
MEDSRHHEVATFAAGCFWDVEAEFRRLKGIVATRVGYTGGAVPDPTYEMVSSGTTGHVEAVQVVFDSTRISYEELLDLFWSMVDPSREKDERTRSVIFYHSQEQRAAAEASRDRFRKTTGQDAPAEILPSVEFWNAEEGHQQFYEKCGQGFCVSEDYRE